MNDRASNLEKPNIETFLTKDVFFSTSRRKYVLFQGFFDFDLTSKGFAIESWDRN